MLREGWDRHMTFSFKLQKPDKESMIQVCNIHQNIFLEAIVSFETMLSVSDKIGTIGEENCKTQPSSSKAE